jgi:hypothetical protein
MYHAPKYYEPSLHLTDCVSSLLIYVIRGPFTPIHTIVSGSERTEQESIYAHHEYNVSDKIWIVAGRCFLLINTEKWVFMVNIIFLLIEASYILNNIYARSTL